MRRTQSLVRVLTVLGMALAVVLAGHTAQRASAQAAGETDITIVSVVADDPTDSRFQTAYTYFVDAGPVDGVTASAAGSESYQAYDGDTGDILDTQAVGANGTVTLIVPVGLNNHVININDPGNGSEAVSGGSTVTVVINPGAGSQPTVEPTTVPTNAPTFAPSATAGTGGGNSSTGNSGSGSSGTALPNTGAGTGAPTTAPLTWLLAGVLAVIAIAAASLTLRRRTAQR